MVSVLPRDGQLLAMHTLMNQVFLGFLFYLGVPSCTHIFYVKSQFWDEPGPLRQHALRLLHPLAPVLHPTLPHQFLIKPLRKMYQVTFTWPTVHGGNTKPLFPRPKRKSTCSWSCLIVTLSLGLCDYWDNLVFSVISCLSY